MVISAKTESSIQEAEMWLLWGEWRCLLRLMGWRCAEGDLPGRKNILYKDSGSWEIAVCLCGQAVSSG